MRVAAAVVAALVFLAAAGGGTPRSASAAGDPVVAAAGDIACGVQDTNASCHEAATSDILVRLKSEGTLSSVSPLGDVQYECGETSNFYLADSSKRGYDRNWGRVKSLTHPAIGNHEYQTYPSSSTCLNSETVSGAPGYFKYFGFAASPLDGTSSKPCTAKCKAYYSYNLGAWHIVALNSECAVIACTAGAPQETWLRNDLARTTQPCILAYWHRPRYSSYTNSTAAVQPLWQDLYAAHADVVLAGHEHFYERFAKLGAASSSTDTMQPLLDPNGIREFIVGTGGQTHMPFGTIRAGSEVRNNDTFGVLKLTLHSTSYDWEFLPEEGRTFNDSGTTACNRKDTQAPSVPGGLTAAARSPVQVDLSWTASSDNVGVAGYEIWRRRAGGTLAKLVTVSGTETTYSDTSVTSSTTYSYEVKAVDAAGNTSGASNTATVTTPSVAAPPPPTTSATPAGPPPPNGNSNACGSVLQSLKTLSDPLRNRVNLRPRATTIAAINRMPRPQRVPARRTAFERQVWRVSARIAQYKLAANAEIHLILLRRGWHMIAKMPSPACLPKTTRDRRAMIAARRLFQSRCRRATPEWRSLGAIAQIDGVGFWETQRGQRGHARNDAQLHPVTRIRILSGCS